MGDWCYYVTSEQEDSPGAADVVCKRYYADAAVFEPTDQSHWDTVSDWYTPLFQGVVGKFIKILVCSISSYLYNSIAYTHCRICICPL